MNPHNEIIRSIKTHKLAILLPCPNSDCNAKPKKPCISTVGSLRENEKGDLERLYLPKRGQKNTHPSRRKLALRRQNAI